MSKSVSILFVLPRPWPNCHNCEKAWTALSMQHTTFTDPTPDSTASEQEKLLLDVLIINLHRFDSYPFSCSLIISKNARNQICYRNDLVRCACLKLTLRCIGWWSLPSSCKPIFLSNLELTLPFRPLFSAARAVPMPSNVSSGKSTVRWRFLSWWVIDCEEAEWISHHLFLLFLGTFSALWLNLQCNYHSIILFSVLKVWRVLRQM